RKHVCLRDDCPLRHGAIRWAASTEEYALPVREVTDSVNATNKRNASRPGVVRTLCQLLVNRLERSRVNMHKDFAVTRNWFRKFFTSRWSPDGVYNGSVHPVPRINFLAYCTQSRIGADFAWLMPAAASNRQFRL